MEQRTRIRKLSQVDKELAEQIRSIYFVSFPEWERIDFSAICRTVSHGIRTLFTLELWGKVIGFALVNPLSDTHIKLLEYLAIAPEMRNQGFGAAFLQWIAQTLREEGADGILLEVESEDEEGLSRQEECTRRRRIQFYLRNGFQAVECVFSYCMPNLTGTGSLPMKLMWKPLVDTTPTLKGQTLEEAIVAIYTDSYGRSTDDPLLQSVLESLVC